MSPATMTVCPESVVYEWTLLSDCVPVTMSGPIQFG